MLRRQKPCKKIEAVEIGYFMGKNWWGAGNYEKSGRVMVKAGMQYEGTMRAVAKNRHYL